MNIYQYQGDCNCCPDEGWYLSVVHENARYSVHMENEPTQENVALALEALRKELSDDHS